MEYKKQMKELLLSGLPAKDMLRAMERMMELREIERDFASGIDTLKAMLEVREKALKAGLDRLAEGLK